MTILPPVSVLITAGIKALRLLKKKELGELPVSYTHLRAHETRLGLVCRLLRE